MRKFVLKSINVAIYAFAFVLAAVSLIGLFVPEVGEFMAVYVGGGGAVLANLALQGTVTAEEVKTVTSDAHQERHISKLITMMKPDEFPLDTMVREVRKAETARNQKVEFEEVLFRGRTDTVDGAFTQASDATDLSVALGVDTIGLWGAGDEVLVPSVLGHDSKPMRLLVLSVSTSASEITVTAVNGQDSTNFQRVKSIADGAALIRLGVAKSELDSTTDVVTQFPSQSFNYTQIQMAYLEESVVNSLQESYSKYGYSDLMFQELYNFRTGCNYTNWFGKKARIVRPNDNKVVYKADGIFDLITNSSDYGTGSGNTTMTIANILDFIKDAFADNSGSAKRVLFAGKGLISSIQKVTFDKNQMAKDTEIVHGVTCTKLVSDFGTVYIKHEKAFDQTSLGYSNYGALVDIDNVVKHDFEAMKKEEIDPDRAGIRRVKNAYRLLENSCLTLRYAGAHRIWKPAA